MATWELSTEYKKNAVEVQLWYKDGVTIKKIDGYRWGTFYCESDERPDIDLRNPDGYELTDYDWELIQSQNQNALKLKKPGTTSGMKAWKHWAGATMILSIISTVH